MVLNYIWNAIGLAFILSLGSSLAINLLKFLIRKHPQFPPFHFIKSRLIKYRALKLESLGYKVYMYISWVDGKKIRVQDMEAESKLNFRDPIVFEQHPLRDLPFKAKINCLICNIETKKIVGKGFRINSNSSEIVDFEYGKEEG